MSACAVLATLNVSAPQEWNVASATTLTVGDGTAGAPAGGGGVSQNGTGSVLP